MDAIEKIIIQLDQQAQAEETQLQEKETARITQEYQTGLVEIEDNYQRRLSQQLNTLEEKYKQLKNRQQVAIKQETLNQKQALLDQMFLAAEAEMKSWTAAEHRSFAEAALQELALTGELNFVAGAESQDAYTEDWLVLLNQKLPFQLVLSDETVANQAGFILNHDGIQYNFLYSALIQEEKEELGFNLAQAFFK